MMEYGFRLSEERRTPVLMRVTTRMAHSRAVVEVDTEAKPIAPISYPQEAWGWVLLPANSKSLSLKSFHIVFYPIIVSRSDAANILCISRTG